MFRTRDFLISSPPLPVTNDCFLSWNYLNYTCSATRSRFSVPVHPMYMSQFYPVGVGGWASAPQEE